MIATDFAPNETAGDALASLIILTRPWMWFDGKERDEVSRIMGDMFPGGTAIPFLSGRAALTDSPCVPAVSARIRSCRAGLYLRGCISAYS
jgi:hypothetical protein